MYQVFFRKLDFKEAIQLERPKKIYEKLVLVNYDKEENIECLGRFLDKQIDEHEYSDSIGLRRLIRIYDFVKYGK